MLLYEVEEIGYIVYLNYYNISYLFLSLLSVGNNVHARYTEFYSYGKQWLSDVGEYLGIK